MMTTDLAILFDITLRAGTEILKIYQQDIEVETKADSSPLTSADKKSHQVIMEGLLSIYPDIPILSEEGRQVPYQERRNWNQFWLVDPLDGTKEFIKKNGEFTVNIALIERGFPSIGMVYAPVPDTLYFGKIGKGAFKLERATETFVTTEAELIKSSVRLPEVRNTDQTRVVASRSHMSEDTQSFIEELQIKTGQVDVISAGSSLKFCLVAEGKADFYPRFAPTMEWDTAAGQAVVEAAGGKVSRHSDNKRFYYNRENLTNEWFLAEAPVKDK